MSRIALVRISDDWKALYVNDMLVDENHNFTVPEFCRLVGIPLLTYDISDSWDSDYSPKTLMDVLETLK